MNAFVELWDNYKKVKHKHNWSTRSRKKEIGAIFKVIMIDNNFKSISDNKPQIWDSQKALSFKK